MNDTAAVPAPDPKAALGTSAAPREISVGDIYIEFLLIGATSQTLPGLNATNMAILVGDELRGALGAIAAVVGICLPGALLMYAVGMAYHVHGDRPMVTAALKGVAAAAVGLILATTWQLGRKSLAHTYDVIFIAITVLGVNYLHQSV